MAYANTKLSPCLQGNISWLEQRVSKVVSWRVTEAVAGEAKRYNPLEPGLQALQALCNENDDSENRG